MGTLRITPMDQGPASDDGALPILRPAGDTIALATTTATGRVAVPTGKWVRLVADEAMMVKLGDVTVNAVVATDFPLVAGIPEYLPRDGNGYIAAIDLA